MTKDQSIGLSDFLQRKADDYLRSVLHYDDEEYSLVYIRDDVAEKYSEEAVEQVVEELHLEGSLTPRQESLYPHGDLNCTVRCFQNAVEMHFPHTETAGTAVAMDAQVVEELYSFVGDCLTVLRS